MNCFLCGDHFQVRRDLDNHYASKHPGFSPGLFKHRKTYEELKDRYDEAVLLLREARESTGLRILTREKIDFFLRHKAWEF